MLKTVRNYIDQLPTCTFPEYYQNYIISIQDRNIDAEFKNLIKYNKLSVKKLDLLIAGIYERICNNGYK